MKLMASELTCSAASVRSPSFSRFSSSTTTTMRPARISARAPGTSVNGGSKLRGVCGITAPSFSPMPGANSKSAARRQRFWKEYEENGLQRRFDLKSPCFEKSLRDIFGILVPPSPLTQAGGPDVLIRAEFELPHDLLEGGDGGHNRADGVRAGPTRVS